MSISTFTAVDEYNQLCGRLGIAPPLLVNTTLNEQLNVLSGDQGVDTSQARPRYLALGNGGHDAVTNNGITGITSKNRLAQYQGLYNIMPLALRTPSNDFTPAEANKYRMRRLELHGGISYYAYYLKVIDLNSIVPALYLETTDNGVITKVPYAHGVSDLSHPNFTPSTGTASNRLLVEVELNTEFTAEEVTDIQNACEIIFGGTGFSVASELGVYSGVDLPITADLNGNTVQLNEVANVHLMMSNSTGRLLDFTVGDVPTSIKFGRAFSYNP